MPKRFCKNGHDTEICGRDKRDRCRECHRLQAAERYAANPEKGRAISLAWRTRNPDKARSVKASYLAVNRQRERDRSTMWRIANPDKMRICKANWRNSNPAAVRAYKANRRDRKRGAEGNYTAADITAIIERQKGRCAECGKICKLTIDHIVPLSKGGSNYPRNLQGLCLLCNSTKQARDPIEWARIQGRLL